MFRLPAPRSARPTMLRRFTPRLARLFAQSGRWLAFVAVTTLLAAALLGCKPPRKSKRPKLVEPDLQAEPCPPGQEGDGGCIPEGCEENYLVGAGGGPNLTDDDFVSCEEWLNE